jgi:hypothetical protein
MEINRKESQGFARIRRGLVWAVVADKSKDVMILVSVALLSHNQRHCNCTTHLGAFWCLSSLFTGVTPSSSSLRDPNQVTICQGFGRRKSPCRDATREPHRYFNICRSPGIAVPSPDPSSHAFAGAVLTARLTANPWRRQFTLPSAEMAEPVRIHCAALIASQRLELEKQRANYEVVYAYRKILNNTAPCSQRLDVGVSTSPIVPWVLYDALTFGGLSRYDPTIGTLSLVQPYPPSCSLPMTTRKTRDHVLLGIGTSDTACL